MDNWLILQNFYSGLTLSSRDHVDAAAGGAFFSLTIERATTLIEKMVLLEPILDAQLRGHASNTGTRPLCSLDPMAVLSTSFYLWGLN